MCCYLTQVRPSGTEIERRRDYLREGFGAKHQAPTYIGNNPLIFLCRGAFSRTENLVLRCNTGAPPRNRQQKTSESERGGFGA